MSIDETPDSQARSIVYDAMRQCHHTRSQYWMAQQTDSVSRNTLLRFQQAILDYHDELRRYRSDVKKKWKNGLENTGYDHLDDGLDALPYIINRQQTQTDEVSQGGMKRVRVQRKPVVLPGNDLLAISYNLDDIAEHIGFATETKTPVAGLDEAEV